MAKIPREDSVQSHSWFTPKRYTHPTAFLRFTGYFQREYCIVNYVSQNIIFWKFWPCVWSISRFYLMLRFVYVLWGGWSRVEDSSMFYSILGCFVRDYISVQIRSLRKHGKLEKYCLLMISLVWSGSWGTS